MGNIKETSPELLKAKWSWQIDKATGEDAKFHLLEPNLQNITIITPKLEWA